MLVENDYESWKIRIHRYIRGKPNGKLIWKSIQNGPTPHPMVTDPPPTDSTIVPAPRKKLDSEFSEEENKLEMADTQAEIIHIDQVFPKAVSTSPTTSLRTSSNSKTHCTVIDGQIVTEPIQRKGSRTQEKDGLLSTTRDKALLMEAKEKGDSVRSEAEHSLLMLPHRTL
ncbi:hypothetical protein Tco_0089977 [Tanacetum coccineum]